MAEKILFSIRIPTELREKLQKEADKEHRSLNNLIEIILTDYSRTKKY